MIDLEDELRTMLQLRADEVTPVSSVDLGGLRSRHVSKKVVAPAVGVLVAVVAVIVVAANSPGGQVPSRSDVASTEGLAQTVEGLSATEVARKFDLELDGSAVITGCNRGVGTGEGVYCLDDLPPMDDWTREHIAVQLMGYEDNVAMHDYVATAVERLRLKAEDPGSPELRALDRELLDRLSDLTKVGAPDQD
jgi:hypothetical protein